ncbi:PSP1 C-terminal domain-containing protein [Tundrisphaera lichenicola]|uniref:PSP1 C-terminal domain-containing protein n=1 Tax=Tundrisphaera lichenicola TaxID=2029860 RepID=UPI003EBC1FB1
MGRVYLIRYGLANAVGRFATDSESFEPGRWVVIRTHRGAELGRVLAEAPPAPDSEPGLAPILRQAGPDDLERSNQAVLDRRVHFDACRAIFDEGDWPLELIDAEPLLEPGRTVLHYLGPHRLDASGLVAALRSRCGLDVVLEPAGRDVPESEAEPEPEPESHGCGDCGSSGGCGSGGCGTESGGCAVKAIVASRRRVHAEG